MIGGVRRPSLFAAILGFTLGFVGTAVATVSSSSEVRFFGPTNVGGAIQCATETAWIRDNASPPASAQAITTAYFGQNCLNLNSVPAGYLGAQVHLVRGQAPGGTLCGSTPWQFNTSSIPIEAASRNWTQSSNCPAGVGYYSSAHGEYWNANTSTYKKSNWINSPSLNLP